MNVWYTYKALWLYRESEQQVDILENKCSPMHKLLTTVVKAVQPLPRLEVLD